MRVRFNGEVKTGPAKFVVGFLLTVLLLFAGGPGFRSRAQMDEHYAKHGAEFGHISEAEYLRLAQELRDAPVGGPILEAPASQWPIQPIRPAQGLLRRVQSGSDHPHIFHSQQRRTVFSTAGPEAY